MALYQFYRDLIHIEETFKGEGEKSFKKFDDSFAIEFVGLTWKVSTKLTRNKKYVKQYVPRQGYYIFVLKDIKRDKKGVIKCKRVRYKKGYVGYKFKYTFKYEVQDHGQYSQCVYRLKRKYPNTILIDVYTRNMKEGMF